MAAGCWWALLLLSFPFGQVALSSLAIPATLLMKVALWIPHFQTWCCDYKGQINILNLTPTPTPTLAKKCEIEFKM